jgi:hypothetical protein
MKIATKWKMGTGISVKFWEDNWLGPSSLTAQLWDIYILLNEKNGTVHDLCEGNGLKCSFRRCVDANTMTTEPE